MLKLAPAPCNATRIQTWDIEAAVPSVVAEVIGVAWPENTGAVASGRNVDVIGVGPTEWLVVAADTEHASLLKMIDKALTGSAFRATDMSHGLVRIRVDGPEVRDLLAKGCTLDLHPKAFPCGRAARTRFAGMPVIVRCIQQWSFECIVSGSFSEYLMSWLEDAAREFAEPP